MFSFPRYLISFFFGTCTGYPRHLVNSIGGDSKLSIFQSLNILHSPFKGILIIKSFHESSVKQSTQSSKEMNILDFNI